MNDNDLKMGIAITIAVFLVIETLIGCIFTYNLYNPGLPPC